MLLDTGIPFELLDQRPVAQALRLAGVFPSLIVTALDGVDVAEAHVRGGVGWVELDRPEEQCDGGISLSAKVA